MTDRASQSPSARAALEAVVLTAAAPLLGAWIDPRDPFLLHRGFSWLGFVPLLVGLRHGFMLACAGALLLDGALVCAWRMHAFGVATFPDETVVALLALAMLAGQFSGVWRRDTRRLDGEVDSLRGRFDELSRAHCLLELSHDRLVELSQGAPNLRDALDAVRELGAGAATRSLESQATDIVEIFETYCMLQAASLHAVTDAGEIVARPLAVVGRPRAVSPEDPLLRKALATRQLAYAPTTTPPPRGSASSLLVAAPFLRRRGWGGTAPAAGDASAVGAVLCIESLPFIAFHQKNLEVIATLAAHLADGIWGRSSGSLALERREDFERRLERELRDVRVLEVSAVVAALYVRQDSPMSDIVPAVLGGSLRDQDVPFVVRDARGNHLVYLLLPKADEDAARALEERIASFSRQELNLPLDRVGAAYAYHVPDGRDTAPGVMQLLAQKAHFDDQDPASSVG
jgi:hypothetical protein